MTLEEALAHARAHHPALKSALSRARRGGRGRARPAGAMAADRRRHGAGLRSDGEQHDRLVRRRARRRRSQDWRNESDVDGRLGPQPLHARRGRRRRRRSSTSGESPPRRRSSTWPTRRRVIERTPSAFASTCWSRRPTTGPRRARNRAGRGRRLPARPGPPGDGGRRGPERAAPAHRADALRRRRGPVRGRERSAPLERCAARRPSSPRR